VEKPARIIIISGWGGGGGGGWTPLHP